jgi:hypothetical protein
VRCSLNAESVPIVHVDKPIQPTDSQYFPKQGHLSPFWYGCFSCNYEFGCLCIGSLNCADWFGGCDRLLNVGCRKSSLCHSQWWSVVRHVHAVQLVEIGSLKGAWQFLFSFTRQTRVGAQSHYRPWKPPLSFASMLGRSWTVLKAHSAYSSMITTGSVMLCWSSERYYRREMPAFDSM